MSDWATRDALGLRGRGRKRAVAAVCGNCGYSMQGVDHAAVCPECGTIRSEAVAGGPLEDASKDYQIRLKRGARLVFWGLVAEIALPLIWFAGAVAFFARAEDPNATTTPATQLASDALFGGLRTMLHMIPLAVQLLGAWWYTLREVETAEVKTPGEPKQQRWRIATLAGYGFAIACTLTAAILVWAGFPEDIFADGLDGTQMFQAAAVMAANLLAAVGALVALMGLLGFTQRLADRADDTHLESHSRGLKWALVFLLPLGSFLAFFTWVALVLCCVVMHTMLRHVKYALARKPEYEVEEFVHSRPLP